MSNASLREKTAAQIVEINRKQAELKQFTDELAERDRTIAELEAKAAVSQDELRRREEEVSAQAERLAEAERALRERADEIETLGRMYDEASFSASNRQIELAAREAELERKFDDRPRPDPAVS